MRKLRPIEHRPKGDSFKGFLVIEMVDLTPIVIAENEFLQPVGVNLALYDNFRSREPLRRVPSMKVTHRFQVVGLRRLLAQKLPTGIIRLPKVPKNQARCLSLYDRAKRKNWHR